MLSQEKRRKNKKEGRWVRRGGRAGRSLYEHNMHQTFDIQPFTKDFRNAKTRKKKKNPNTLYQDMGTPMWQSRLFTRYYKKSTPWRWSLCPKWLSQTQLLDSLSFLTKADLGQKQSLPSTVKPGILISKRTGPSEEYTISLCKKIPLEDSDPCPSGLCSPYMN